jgi:hypothetical protein
LGEEGGEVQVGRPEGKKPKTPRLLLVTRRRRRWKVDGEALSVGCKSVVIPKALAESNDWNCQLRKVVDLAVGSGLCGLWTVRQWVAGTAAGQIWTDELACSGGREVDARAPLTEMHFLWCQT